MTESESTRREFLRNAGQAGVASTLLTAGVTNMKQTQGQTDKSSDSHSCLDYRRSFLCGTSDLNSVRFWIESRTTIEDTSTDKSAVFYQCASCKSENTFGESDLFYADNYDFLPIHGDGYWLLFRRTARLNPAHYRDVFASPNAWGDPRFILHEGANTRSLNTWEDIRDATAAGIPLVSQTELMNEETSLRAVIECPVKTMNISHEKQMYQVDTGPIAFPDLTKKSDPLIDCLRLAFVAFNQDHFADFVIEQPTPVIEDGVEKCSIYHYSNPVSLAATNRLLTHD